MQREMTPIRIMGLTVAVLVVVGLAWMAVRLGSFFALLVIGMIFAAAIEPTVNRLRRRGLTRIQAILTVYVGLLALIAFTALLVVPPLLIQASDLVDDVPNILQELRRQTADSPNSFINTTLWDALLRAERAWIEFRAEPPIEGQQAISLVSSTLGGLLSVVTVFMVAFYWLTEKATIKKLVISMFPVKNREMVNETWENIEYKLGGWTRGQLTLCLIIGTMSTIAYFALDLPFWLALGIFAGITEIVPFIGPIVGGGAAVTIALTDSWQKAIIVLIFVVLLQQVESAMLVPRVMRHAVGMSPLTVILAVLIGGRMGGILGSVLAIPVGAVVQVLLQVILRQRLNPEEAPTTPEPPPALAIASGPPPGYDRPREVRIVRRRRVPTQQQPTAAPAHSSSAKESTSSNSSTGGDPSLR